MKYIIVELEDEYCNDGRFVVCEYRELMDTDVPDFPGRNYCVPVFKESWVFHSMDEAKRFIVERVKVEVCHA